MAGVSIDTNTLVSNVVPQKVMRKIQENVLKDLAEVLEKCYGPDASNTLILVPTGENGLANQKPISKYTKDGRHILEKVTYTGMLENAIAGQIETITSAVDKAVGDGTTSATLLSYFVYKAMLKIEDEICSTYKLSPRDFMRNFKEVVDMIRANLLYLKRNTTLDDIYNIAYTSTNGDEMIAAEIFDIYKEFGMDVWINVGFSNTSASIVKAYDGLTLEVGYSDPAYVNTNEGTVKMRDPKIYQFSDPIDNAEMVSFLRQIISHNILEPIQRRKGSVIPTLIIAPKISRDADAVIKSLVDYLYQYKDPTMKPPIAIVTNIGPHMASYIDIAHLCGCKKIIKYIDAKTQKEDIEKGLAPSLENIHEWYGSAEMVEIDEFKTAFVNPADMLEYDEDHMIKHDEDGNPIKTKTFETLLNFLKSELENAEKTGEDANTIGNLRRRIHSLGFSLVDYYVGGVSTEDITAVKDAVEDAVKNCRSAARCGVGPAANCAGFISADMFITAMNNDLDSNKVVNIADVTIKSAFANGIVQAYKDLLKVLYSTSYSDELDQIYDNIIKKQKAFNIETGAYDGKVVCSIETDEAILNAVTEIISYMFTSNQALLPVASAKYTEAFGSQL